jgi:multiple sugar transport system substrate-binding protein
VASESFLPLNDVVAAQNINLDDMNPAALAASNCLVDGQVYCMGSYTGAVLLFYNKDMFDAAGIAYPSPTDGLTIDQYADIAQQLTVLSDNIEERVWGGDAQYWFMDWHNYFSDDVRTAEGYLNDEATAHAFQTLTDLVADGSLLSSADEAQFNPADLVATGQLATMITDNAVAIPRLEAAGINWGATAPPRESTDVPLFADQWTDGLGVPAASDQPEAAALFVTFWGTVGNEERLKLGDLSLNLDLAASSAPAARRRSPSRCWRCHRDAPG